MKKRNLRYALKRPLLNTRPMVAVARERERNIRERLSSVALNCGKKCSSFSLLADGYLKKVHYRHLLSWSVLGLKLRVADRLLLRDNQIVIHHWHHRKVWNIQKTPEQAGRELMMIPDLPIEHWKKVETDLFRNSRDWLVTTVHVITAMNGGILQKNMVSTIPHPVPGSLHPRVNGKADDGVNSIRPRTASQILI